MLKLIYISCIDEKIKLQPPECVLINLRLNVHVILLDYNKRSPIWNNTCTGPKINGLSAVLVLPHAYTVRSSKLPLSFKVLQFYFCHYSCRCSTF